MVTEEQFPSATFRLVHTVKGASASTANTSSLTTIYSVDLTKTETEESDFTADAELKVVLLDAQMEATSKIRDQA